MVRKDIITLLTMPGGRSFSEDHGKHGVHDAFRNAVDKMLASGEPSYTYGKGGPKLAVRERSLLS